MLGRNAARVVTVEVPKRKCRYAVEPAEISALVRSVQRKTSRLTKEYSGFATALMDDRAALRNIINKCKYYTSTTYDFGERQAGGVVALPQVAWLYYRGERSAA